MLQNPPVSLFVDDRENDAGAIGDIHGIEARGTAIEITGEERERYGAIYRARHPGLSEFAGNSALIGTAVLP